MRNSIKLIITLLATTFIVSPLFAVNQSNDSFSKAKKI